MYAHLAKESTLKKGDKVKAGETIIGKVGGGKNTPSGTASTGAHLHLSIGKANKTFSNPNIHLAAYTDLVDPIKHMSMYPTKIGQNTLTSMLRLK